jgi:hypothetical protein
VDARFPGRNGHSHLGASGLLPVKEEAANGQNCVKNGVVFDCPDRRTHRKNKGQIPAVYDQTYRFIAEFPTD